MDLSKFERYIDDIKPKPLDDINVNDDMIIVERSELQKIAAEIDANLKRLEKKKQVSAGILNDFNKLKRSLSDMIKRTDDILGIRESMIVEKFYGFGRNGTVEVHGNTVVISKNGSSVEMSKQELVDILIKMGMAKKKVK